jgi:hypothetical protein
VKVAWVVRAEDRGERTCSAGTPPTAHQYHLENLTDAVEETVNQHHARLRDHGEPDKPQSVPPLDAKGLGHTVTAGPRRSGRLSDRVHEQHARASLSWPAIPCADLPRRRPQMRAN